MLRGIRRNNERYCGGSHIEGDTASFEAVKLKAIATEQAKIGNDPVFLQNLAHPLELSNEDNSKMEEAYAEMYFHTTFTYAIRETT